ncbi:MAG: T9SS type A sorting domain-containing protein [Chitinophagaceae bacterium]
MKSKFTLIWVIVSSFLTLSSKTTIAQCNATVNVSTVESRCKATGEINFSVTGGSGNYNYTVTRGAVSSVTSSNKVSGLPAGTYKTEVKDLVTGCVYSMPDVVVTGNYQDPRFQLAVTDVTCINGADGSISVMTQQFGRGPFAYTIIAPSVSTVGTSNSTGTFTNLIPGNYFVRLSDSCGGIQTRSIVVSNYNWWISASTVTKVGCDQATATLTLQDSKGNTNLVGTTFNGYQYGAVRSPGDTSWSNSRSFTFSKGTLRSITLIAKDLCGNIKTLNWTDNKKPRVDTDVSISNKACTDFRATITDQTNLTNPQYCLYNSVNVQIACNGTGVFNNIPYGSYCITIQDICYDTTINRCFTVSQPTPAVAANVTKSNITCSDFTATVTGQQNLTSPAYCLFNSANVQVACNSTGVFNNLPFGLYCIQITDGCTGIVINRCFIQYPYVPVVGAAVSITNLDCSDFTATIGGQGNLTNPQFCIYDGNGVLVACNSTGIFDGLPYGSYCINVKNDPVCYDTTIVRCFTVSHPLPSVAAYISISNKNCTDFTATVTGKQNLNKPEYCLYDNNGVQVSCNNSGQFDNVPYGTYCIRIVNDPTCYDTTIQRCFTVTRPVPSVNSTVQISNKACGTFTATITGQQNLTNPQYCLYDNNNVQISCNNSGVFTNVPYGSYCINVVNTCYDTTIVRCFTVAPIPMGLTVTSTVSCTIGTTNLSCSWIGSSAPYQVYVFNPGGIQEAQYTGGGTSATFSNLASLPVGLRYKIVVLDNCGNSDTTLVTPLASALNKTINANSKCPSGQWQNGAGDLDIFCQYNSGWVVPKIIRKGSSVVNITYNFNSGSNFTFTTMEPDTYIIEYTLQNCSNKVYDTFTLNSYTFPSLDQSAVYVCNNASFGVNAVVNGGLAPFTYEIIGSFPTTPSIVSSPQALPSFNLNTGSSYSLVRLRSIDACGNATINDASILPLGNTIINATSDCFYNNINLIAETIPNATYTWYKKTSATDSIEIATNQSYNIPYMLPSDSGIYVCKTSVNFGCLTRISYFNLTGLCGSFLLAENDLSFKASLKNDRTELQWLTGSNFSADEFVIERSTDGRTYKAITTVKAAPISTSKHQYLYTDNSPEFGKNHYRIKIIKRNTGNNYSKIIVLTRGNSNAISVHPNPVDDHFQIQFNGVASGIYSVSLINATGGLMHMQSLAIVSGETKNIQRPAGAKAGTYFLHIWNKEMNSRQVIKLIFR